MTRLDINQPTIALQSYMPDAGIEGVQVEAFAEFTGKDGKKMTLIDVEKEKARLANKPLDNQPPLL